jgi:Flp pilus assembly protein TadG
MSAQMKPENSSLLARLRRDESGAVIVLVAAAITGLIGLAALSIDVGNLAFAQRRLQAVTDLAALAGAEVINTTSSAVTLAQTYSGIAGAKNAQRGLTMTMVAGYPQLKCLTTISTPCTSATATNSDANAIMVQQQAQVPFLLGQVFGFGTATLTASSLATKGAGGPPPMHIMIVLDNTRSMNDQDTSATTCGGIRGPTRIQCALAGVQSLLTELWPTQDEVGLIVFPPVSSSTASNDYNCSSSKTITPEPYGSYTGPSGSSIYQILGLTNSYKSSNTSGTLTSAGGTSSLINATCQSGMSVGDNGVTGSCGSCQGNKVVGGEGTYLAGAITAAQATLASNTVSGVQNVMIVLSDGGAGNASTLWQGSTSAATVTNGITLTFATGTVPAAVVPGTAVNYECTITGSKNCTSNIPAGTSVSSVDSTNSIVTLSFPSPSTGVTGTIPSGTSINFGGMNQCNEAIVAARDAASAGTWVYSIAYQSYIQASPNSNSCSDTETWPIANVSSCTTMQNIANSPGHIPDASKFYSDPMGLTAPNGPCLSSANPDTTDITSIFENIGSRVPFAALLPNNTQ